MILKRKQFGLLGIGLAAGGAIAGAKAGKYIGGKLPSKPSEEEVEKEKESLKNTIQLKDSNKEARRKEIEKNYKKAKKATDKQIDEYHFGKGGESNAEDPELLKLYPKSDRRKDYLKDIKKKKDQDLKALESKREKEKLKKLNNGDLSELEEQHKFNNKLGGAVIGSGIGLTGGAILGHVIKKRLKKR